MRTDVHFAALRAAAKVAFSMVLLNGCAANEGTDQDQTQGTTGSALTNSRPEKNGTSSGNGGSCNLPADCKGLLEDTFGDDDRYPATDRVVSKDVVACCNAALDWHQHVDFGDHRWACCGAHEEGQPVPERDIAACTPWGPPVPPSIERLKARRARKAAAQLMAVA